jgi:superfamily II DNA/RNA helicase
MLDEADGLLKQSYKGFINRVWLVDWLIVFRQCRFFVLDEADGLLKQGYEGFINRVWLIDWLVDWLIDWLWFRQCRFFVLDEADGLLKQGYEGFINRVHAQIPKVTSDGKRLQVRVSGLIFLDLDLIDYCINYFNYR